MKTIMNIIYAILITFVNLNAHANFPNLSVKNYCQGMGEGLSDEDAKEMISQCIEEQSQYYEDDAMQSEDNSASYEEEATDLNCYDEAEAIIEQEPEADYDMLVQRCLDQHS